MKITKRQLRNLVRESMEELPPPGAGRTQVVSTDARILSDDYIQKAVYDGLKDLDLDESGANEVIRQLYNRPDILKGAIVRALADYKVKLERGR